MKPVATSTLKKYALALGVILLVAFGPILLATGAGIVAEANGCTLHEGFVNPCVIWGADRGEMLYSMGIMFWYSFYTFPLASLAFMVWLIILIIHIVRRAFRKDNPSNA